MMFPQLWRYWLIISSLSLLLLSCASGKNHRWEAHTLRSAGTDRVQVWGDPKVIKPAEGGNALEFDGIDDGLLISGNPISGATAFSIEVELKPYDGFPQNREQRFLHLQDPENERRRILMELRLNKQGEWYPDVFMRTESASLTLIDSTKTFPLGAWARFRVTYERGELRAYVNDAEVLKGEIEYQPISPHAKTSLGVRMNKISWYKGAIRTIRWTTFDVEK